MALKVALFLWLVATVTIVSGQRINQVPSHYPQAGAVYTDSRNNKYQVNRRSADDGTLNKSLDPETEAAINNAVDEISTHLNEDIRTGTEFAYKKFAVTEIVPSPPNGIPELKGKIKLTNLVFKETVCLRSDASAELENCAFQEDGKRQTCHVNFEYGRLTLKIHKIIFVCHPFNVIYDITHLLSHIDNPDNYYKLSRLSDKYLSGSEENIRFELNETLCTKENQFPPTLRKCEFKKDGKHQLCDVRVHYDTQTYPKEVYSVCVDKLSNETNHEMIMYTYKKDKYKVRYNELDIALYTLMRDYFQKTNQTDYVYKEGTIISKTSDEITYQLNYKTGKCTGIHPQPSKISGCIFDKDGKEKQCNITLKLIPTQGKENYDITYNCVDVESTAANITEGLKDQVLEDIGPKILEKLIIYDQVKDLKVTTEVLENNKLIYKINTLAKRCFGEQQTPPCIQANVECTARLPLDKKNCPTGLEYECESPEPDIYLENKELQDILTKKIQETINNYTENKNLFVITNVGKPARHLSGLENQTFQYQETICEKNNPLATGCTIVQTANINTCNVVLHKNEANIPVSIELACPQVENAAKVKKLIDYIQHEIVKDTNNKYSIKDLHRAVAYKVLRVVEKTSKIITYLQIDLQKTDCKKHPGKVDYTKEDADHCNVLPDGDKLICTVHVLDKLKQDVDNQFKFYCRDEKDTQGSNFDIIMNVEGIVIYIPRVIQEVQSATVELDLKDFPFREKFSGAEQWTHACKHEVKPVPSPDGQKQTICKFIRPKPTASISDWFTFNCKGVQKQVFVPCSVMVKINEESEDPKLHKIKEVISTKVVKDGQYFTIVTIETICNKSDKSPNEIPYCQEDPNGKTKTCEVFVHNNSTDLHPNVIYKCTSDEASTPLPSPTQPSTADLKDWVIRYNKEQHNVDAFVIDQIYAQTATANGRMYTVLLTPSHCKTDTLTKENMDHCQKKSNPHQFLCEFIEDILGAEVHINCKIVEPLEPTTPSPTIEPIVPTSSTAPPGPPPTEGPLDDFTELKNLIFNYNKESHFPFYHKLNHVLSKKKNMGITIYAVTLAETQCPTDEVKTPNTECPAAAHGKKLVCTIEDYNKAVEKAPFTCHDGTDVPEPTHAPDPPINPGTHTANWK